MCFEMTRLKRNPPKCLKIKFSVFKNTIVVVS